MKLNFHSRVLLRMSLLLALTLVRPLAHAQDGSKVLTADQQWANIKTALAPSPLSKVNTDGTRAISDLQREARLKLARYRTAAELARQFHLQNPNHPKAAEARKIELVNAFRGVEIGNATEAQAPLTTARAFRGNPANSIADRLEVALAMDQFVFSLRVKSGTARLTVLDRVRLADTLRVEFGDVAALHDHYMEFAREADQFTAQRIARTTLSSPVASASAKARAQMIVDERALIGRKMSLSLTSLKGADTQVGRSTGKLTVLYAYLTKDSRSAEAAEPFLRYLPKDAEIIYVGMGGTRQQMTPKESVEHYKRNYCHVPAGLASRGFIENLKLQYAPLPRVFVVDGNGVLSAIGAPADIPNLLRTATAQAVPPR